MNSIKVCEYSRSRSFHDDLILQDQASGERSQDQWSSGFFLLWPKWLAKGQFSKTKSHVSILRTFGPLVVK